ncbi:MAG: hypothetical protein FWE76_01090 [Symbiobacteriaceae bacterium]|nr:hypothetical protein [Symbiobacteriaceae bacterium]
MHSSKHNRSRLLLLIPLVFLTVNTIYFSIITRAINETLLEEKINEITNSVDLIAEVIDGSQPYDIATLERSITRAVEFIDKQYQIYSGAFAYNGEDIYLISTRYYESSALDPFQYSDFLDLVTTLDSGTIELAYKPDHQENLNIHLYFRWVSKSLDGNEARFLIIAGASQQSVTVAPSKWITYGQIASMLVTFCLNVVLVLAIMRLNRLNYSYKGREWRPRRLYDDGY